MSDIPEDIRAKAASLIDAMDWTGDSPHLDGLQTAIAKALMAERERCRLIAADAAQEADGGEYYIAHLIASAIHKPL